MVSSNLVERILCASIFVLLMKDSLSKEWTSRQEVESLVDIKQRISPDTTYDDIKTIENFTRSKFHLNAALRSDELIFLQCYASAIKNKLFPALEELYSIGVGNATFAWWSQIVHLDECIKSYVGRNFDKLSCMDAVLLLEDSHESLAEMHRQVCVERYNWVYSCSDVFACTYKLVYESLDSRTFELIRHLSASGNCSHDSHNRCNRYDQNVLDRELWDELIVRTYDVSKESNGTTAALPIAELGVATYLTVIEKLLTKIREELSSYWSSNVSISDLTQEEFIRLYRHHITAPCRRYLQISSPRLEFEFALDRYSEELSYDSSQIAMAILRREFCWRFTRAGTDIEALKIYLKEYGRNSETVAVGTKLPDLDLSFVRFDWRKLIKLQ